MQQYEDRHILYAILAVAAAVCFQDFFGYLLFGAFVWGVLACFIPKLRL